MWFGYLNRNFEERPNVPVGPHNGFGPAGDDLGQPEYFQTRRQQFVFKVDLPATWPTDRDLVWTLTVNGTTLKAFGSLWPVWEIDAHTISANRGSRTAVDFDEPPNEAPRIVDAPTDLTVAAGEALRLTAAVTDDGLPKPRMDRGARVAGIRRAGAAGAAGDDLPPLNQSLRVSWVQWRGPGHATFDPAIVRVADGQATTTVSFDQPGVYVLRAYAEDARVFTTREVTVTVAPRQDFVRFPPP
jgi:hypothetical protein